MTSKEIRKSGLLELYLLGEITDADKKIVENAIDKDPALLADLQEIDRALFKFAKANASIPSSALEDKIVKNIRQNSTVKANNEETSSPKNKRRKLVKNSLLIGLFTLCLCTMAYQYRSINRHQLQLKKVSEKCDSISTSQLKSIEKLEALQDPSSSFYAFSPTDKFSTTDITLLSNITSKENYLKIDKLPQINEGQSFQLWSLKDGIQPIPLNVFRANNGAIIPLDFEEGTNTYAITIEKREGATVPNLDLLIATVKV